MLQIHHDCVKAKLKVIKVFLLIILYSSIMPTCLLKTKAVHGKRFIIHVPLKIRTHHHTHTVYTQVHGGNEGSSNGNSGSKQTIYKIMGYSTHHTGLTAGGGGGGAIAGGNSNSGYKAGNLGYHRYQGHHGHGHGHGYRYNSNRGGNGGTAYGEFNYDDYSSCENSMPNQGGDMIFNHYSRQDEEDYPDIEAVIDDDMGDDDWE